ncbi:hypothetical protein FOA52_009660 [Chlamydomonas sp. UWO 241]|nr:hypothetical protein FOA52_009660 [Chlamydomonas sp. UWO 241]
MAPPMAVAADPLGPQVILGFCDLNGASLKAIGSLDAAPGCAASTSLLEFPGLDGCRAAFGDDSGTVEAACSTASVTSIRTKEGQPAQVSIIAINAALPEEQQAAACAAIVNLVAASQAGHRAGGGGGGIPGAAQPCLTVLASTLLQASARAGVHAWCSPAASTLPLASALASPCAPLLPTMPVHDNMLALLQHMATATGVAAVFLLAPGHRPPAGSDAAEESGAGCSALLGAFSPALSSAAAQQAGLSGVVAVQLERAARMTLRAPWFVDAREGARHGVMYA